jgi:citrate lyase alpha subunit
VTGAADANGTTAAEAADTAMPAELEAVTVKVYVTPFVRPVNVAVVPAVVTLIPPGEAVTV